MTNKYDVFIAWEETSGNRDVLFALDIESFKRQLPTIHKIQDLINKGDANGELLMTIPGFFFDAEEFSFDAWVSQPSTVHKSMAIGSTKPILWIRNGIRPYVTSTIMGASFFCPIGISLHQMFLR